MLSNTSYELCLATAASIVERSRPVRSTTANRFVPLSSAFLIKYWVPMLIPMSSGIITIEAMKALVCTAALYSRQATAQTLRMVNLFGAGPSDANEDLFQRRVGGCEMPHRSAAHEFGENLLRIGAGLQPQLLQIAE